MSWFCRLYGETHLPNGKRRRFNRMMSFGNGGLSSQILATVNKCKNPWEFYGVTLHLITPIHHNQFVIDPDTQKITNLY